VPRERKVQQLGELLRSPGFGAYLKVHPFTIQVCGSEYDRRISKRLIRRYMPWLRMRDVSGELHVT
jgi:hypothetical protein